MYKKYSTYILSVSGHIYFNNNGVENINYSNPFVYLFCYFYFNCIINITLYHTKNIGGNIYVDTNMIFHIHCYNKFILYICFTFNLFVGAHNKLLKIVIADVI